MSPTVLFVDDEARILDGLRRGLRGMRHEWDLRFALGGPAGVEALTDDLDVVVSDMRMPELDGVDVLRVARTAAPRAARVILSGHSDPDASLRAAGVAHRFVAKPCDANTLHALLPELAALVDAPGQPEPVSACTALVSDAAVVSRLRAILDRSDTTAAPDLAGLVVAEPALTAKVLQVSCSSFFGPGRAQPSLRAAVSHLGPAVLRGLVADPAVVPVARTPEEVGRRRRAEDLRRAAAAHDDVTATVASLRALRPLLPGDGTGLTRLLALWGLDRALLEPVDAAS